MSEPNTTDVAQPEQVTQAADDPKLEYEKVKLLFDYTKFHIGLYTTVAAAIIAFLNLKIFDQAPRFSPDLLWTSVLLIGLAGVAGGIIASTLPECKSLPSFFITRVGPGRLRLLTGRGWAHTEHWAFWFALASVIFAFWFPDFRFRAL
jgi:hypothetical protein